MENMSAYTVLRLLGKNPSARDLPLIWGFADVIGEGGWQRSDFVHSLAASQRFSILTEGTSDAAILKHALALLEPHIADFFSFVDVGHPFSGTGQVINFVKGLVAIGVHNNVLVVFDNDAEGRYAWGRCRQLPLPENVRVLRLPELPEFQQVLVDGPTGSNLADINGRAAAIECYLDIGPSPSFRWSNYNHHIEAYQGELLGKDNYKRAFLGQSGVLAGYAYDKLREVLAMLKRQAIEMNEARLMKVLDNDTDEAGKADPRVNFR
jgi:hypothetical protein